MPRYDPISVFNKQMWPLDIYQISISLLYHKICKIAGFLIENSSYVF